MKCTNCNRIILLQNYNFSNNNKVVDKKWEYRAKVICPACNTVINTVINVKRQDK